MGYGHPGRPKNKSAGWRSVGYANGFDLQHDGLVQIGKLSIRHPEVPARSAGLEGRRPGPFILRGSLRSHLRMTERDRCVPL